MVLNEKGIIKEFELVVYPINFVVVIGDMETEVNKDYATNEEDGNWISGPPPGVAGRTYYGPVILENTYYLDIAPKGTCIIHIPQSYSSVSIPGEWSDYLNYYIELK